MPEENILVKDAQLDPTSLSVLLQSLQFPFTTTQPSYTPNYNKQVVYFDGTNYYLYIHVNGAWRSQQLGVSFVGGRMYRSSGQTISTDTVTRVEFNASTIDGTGITNDPTNNRFTATAAGTYFIHASVTIVLLDGNFFDLYLKKNNGAYSQTRIRASTNNADLSGQISDLITLAFNDYVEIFVQHNAGVDKGLTAGEGTTYFSIHQV